MNLRKLFFSLLLIGAACPKIFSQKLNKDTYGKGHNIVANDSSFALNFEARFQSLYVGVQNRDQNTYSDQFLIRRARLKFKGFVYNPRLTYKFELALSNRDIRSGGIPQSGNTANIVLDAVVKYKLTKNLEIWAGQTKLPGNIERVISSGALQLVDRSNLNSKFNIDRDAGVQLRYQNDYLRVKTAISSGEGRNMTVSNVGGYDYTTRVEWLPFGNFSGKGDYFGADLKREDSPKLMLGFTYDYNDGATREKGQTGAFLSQKRDLKTVFLDAHLKYKGFSSMIEYAKKEAVNSPVVMEENGDVMEAFYVGNGFNAQMGYLFKNNFEIAGRYTEVNPNEETQKNKNQQYTVGLSKYIVGHKLKVQTDFSYIKEESKSDLLQYRFQFELTL
ncbi:porin [Marinigracilibium pacificum]|uniref:FmdC n=1 Tax=Marinigracilibium pacificum TaxID=2729599 RepID=A0A848IZL1_9BACT|nr:porin [Marinigracilibium pacificum]NMM47429.1 FmdC precursor [Marinigracilibium pacificum]